MKSFPSLFYIFFYVLCAVKIGSNIDGSFVLSASSVPAKDLKEEIPLTFPQWQRTCLNVTSYVTGFTSIPQYITFDSLSLLRDYGKGTINFNTIGYVGLNLTLYNTILLSDLLEKFHQIISPQYDALTSVLHPEKKNGNALTRFITKSKIKKIFFTLYLVKVLNYILIISVTGAFLYLQYKSKNLKYLDKNFESKIFNFVYRPITGLSYSKVVKAFDDIKNDKNAWALAIWLKHTARNSQCPNLESFLNLNTQYLIDSIALKRILKDADYFNPKHFGLGGFLKNVWNVILDASTINKILDSYHMSNSALYKAYLGFKASLQVFWSILDYSLAAMDLQRNINYMLNEAMNKIYIEPKVEFVKNAQRKIALRNLLLTDKFEAENLMNSIKIIQKQLRDNEDMTMFPSTIILFVGHSGAGKTTAAEVVLHLIEREMAFYFISAEKASFTGKAPNLRSLDAKDKGTDSIIAAIEFAVKNCSLIYMEDFEQVVSNRIGMISLENYVILNCMLRYFNVGTDNAETQKFHGVAVCTTSYPKKIDQAALRRTGTIILLNYKSQKEILKGQKLFLIQCIFEAYEDENLSQILNTKHTQFYLKVLLQKSVGSAPHQVIKIAQNVFTKCLIYGQNVIKSQRKIKAGIMVHKDPQVQREIMNASRQLTKKQFEKIAIETD